MNVNLASIFNGRSVDEFSLSFISDHVEKSLSEVIVDAAIPDHLVSEQNQSQVVDVLAVVLLHINSVHVHEDITDHDHGGLVVAPSCIQSLEEVVVEG